MDSSTAIHAGSSWVAWQVHAGFACRLTISPVVGYAAAHGQVTCSLRSLNPPLCLWAKESTRAMSLHQGTWPACIHRKWSDHQGAHAAGPSKAAGEQRRWYRWTHRACGLCSCPGGCAQNMLKIKLAQSPVAATQNCWCHAKHHPAWTKTHLKGRSCILGEAQAARPHLLLTVPVALVWSWSLLQQCTNPGCITQGIAHRQQHAAHKP
jgi:hypothetical protein